ncbi:MAG: XrtA system polysaccharide chain length determinant [Casimicrobiaceae bacterium]
MDDLIRQALYLGRGMWQRRWLGLVVLWVVGIAAAFAILRIPDKYEASARIYLDTQSVLKPLMTGIAVQPNVEQKIMILSRTLISRPNVEKLVRMADLDLASKSKEDEEQMIDGLMKTLQISSAGRDNLYTLSYRDPDPAKAKRVVQSLTSIFLDTSLGGKRTDSDTAKKFIDAQIQVYEKKLEDAENRLKEFKVQHMNLASADGKDYYGKINEVSTTLAQAKLDLHEAENSRDALKRQVAGEEPMFLPEPTENASATTGPSEVDARLDTLRRNLDSLRLRYTDEHPDIIGLKRVIADLEEQKQKELAVQKQAATRRGAASGNPVNANPVYQQLKVSLAEAEANVASLGTRVAEYQSRYAALRASALRVPEIEAEFTQLNRDYDINKKNYDALVSRRESAEISGDMEATTGVADFRLIDPPRVSPKPVSPDRVMLFPLALLGALAAGLLATFIASQAWPTFFDIRALREVTGLAVLGTVSMVVDPARKRKERRGLVGFLSAFLAFFASFGAGLLLIFLQTARAV